MDSDYVLLNDDEEFEGYDQPPVELYPKLEVAVENPRHTGCNGVYKPTRYSDIKDNYIRTYCAPRSGCMAWTKTVKDGDDFKEFVLYLNNIHLMMEYQHLESSVWELSYTYDGGAEGIGMVKEESFSPSRDFKAVCSDNGMFAFFMYIVFD